MSEMFRVAGRCRKSQRFYAFIIASVITFVIATYAFITINSAINAIVEATAVSAIVTPDDIELNLYK